MKAGKKIVAAVICCLLFLTGICFAPQKQAVAASDVLDLKQIEQTFAQAIKKGKQSVTFTAPASYSTAQIKNALEKAAKSQNRLLAGSVQFRNPATRHQDQLATLKKDFCSAA